MVCDYVLGESGHSVNQNVPVIVLDVCRISEIHSVNWLFVNHCDHFSVLNVQCYPRIS